MKVLIRIIIIVFFIYIFEYLIYINSKSTKPIWNSTRTQLRKITVRSLIDDQILEGKSIQLKEFSGLYEEISSIERRNNINNKYNIEEIYFLLTTNTHRIRHTINFIKFWSKYGNIQCIIVFEEKDFLRTETIKEYLQNDQIPCHIETSNISRYEERYFHLIKLGWDYINKFNLNNKVEWFAIGDDDTIWFINNLLKTLEQYNSSKLIYLGNYSDRNDSIQRHGNYYAYGGAGILLTKPLIKLISKYSLKCQKDFVNTFGGDEIIGKCITKLLNISLTRNNHFHQIDHEGDIHGLLQSGFDGLVTLHHMFSLWEPFPEEHLEYEKDIINTIKVAYNTFNQDFLKRFYKTNFQTNQTLLLTNGYSFTIFNRILSLEELNQVEITWTNSQLYRQTTRPKENNKINYFFKQLTNQYSKNSIYQNNQQQIEIIFN